MFLVSKIQYRKIFNIIFSCSLFVASTVFAQENIAAEKQEISTEKTDQDQIIPAIPAIPVISAEKTAKTLAVFSEKVPISRQLWGGIKREDLEIIKKIAKNVDKSDFEDALDHAKQFGTKSFLHEKISDFIYWNWYSSDLSDLRKVSFAQITDFVSKNDLPSTDLIRRNAEGLAIKEDLKYPEYEKYLQKSQLLTIDAKLHALKAKASFADSLPQGDEKRISLQNEIRKNARDLWVGSLFSKSQEQEFLKSYQNYLTFNDHVARIEYLLWNDKFDDAKRIMDFVTEDYQKLFNAVIEISKADRYIDKILLSVPRSMRDSELLTYERVIWHHKKQETDEVVDLLLKVKTSKKFSDQWWRYRKYYSRELLKTKDYDKAYKIIANHGLSISAKDFWEGEWTSGWIALRFLDKPQNAYTHFSNLYKNVRQPVSVARAAYWLGMASNEMGNKQQAIAWYKIAAKYPLFFYGQLAIHKHKTLDTSGAKTDVVLPETPKITADDLAALKITKSLQIAYVAALLGDKKDAFELFKYAVQNAKTDGEVVGIVKVAREIDDPELTFKVSREAGKRNVFFIKEDFIIKKVVGNDKYAPIVHAIIKQESGFVQSATSSVGALGFMQIMPDTAKTLAKELDIRYSRQKLITDVDYNIKLGSYYIKQLIDKFEGSEIMAIASYNAGPNSTKRWSEEFFDPRKEDDVDKVVDWIELITYSETRNYVQRVMENLIVYKYLMYRNNYDEVK